MNIAVAGTGYVGLSISMLLAQHNKVKAVKIIPEKVELISRRKSPIQGVMKRIKAKAQRLLFTSRH